MVKAMLLIPETLAPTGVRDKGRRMLYRVCAKCRFCDTVAKYTRLTNNNYRALKHSEQLLNCPNCRMRDYDEKKAVCKVAELAETLFLDSYTIRKLNGEVLIVDKLRNITIKK